MYWAVISCFTASEVFGDVLVSWLPFYYEAKVAIIIYLVCNRKAAVAFYRKYLHPTLETYEGTSNTFFFSFKRLKYIFFYQITSTRKLRTLRKKHNVVPHTWENSVSKHFAVIRLRCFRWDRKPWFRLQRWQLRLHRFKRRKTTRLLLRISRVRKRFR